MDERKAWARSIEGAIKDATRSYVPLRNRVARPVVVLATAPSLSAVAAVLRDETAVVGRESLASRTRPGHAGDPRGDLDLAARARRCRARRWEKSPLAFRAVVGEYRESGLRRSERRDVTVAVERTSIVVSVVFLCLVALAELAGVAHAERPAANPPGPSFPQMPKGHSTRCTMSGPAWSAWGIHTPNAPPRRGTQYLVTSWGIPCGQAKALLRVFFPRVPAYSVGRIAGAPKGFVCRGAANGLSKNRLYMGSCIRLSPATMIDWGPIGGKVG